MQKILTTIVVSIAVICITFGAGYLTGHFRKDSNQNRPSSDNSDKISRIIELTREYLVAERASISSERNLVEQQRNQLAIDRTEFERERQLFDRQREAAKADRGDLTELTNLLNEIRVLAQSEK